ncbi:hypothetical protein ASPVEDRAFT_41056 [Aspergillus versicolor CBS 583.65]|uniref:Uncharacterized protein n=1 Tax=Aspergillus versicolor CBS 583.65 TaxID=1036611 RepID=A0A1L9PIX8_ASPVE|nr:uncharacterized protein ASPVEDRAFT_41056 [Aspergillus versicolor CBS 583.65]OJJ01474.1 hypothetical protein ASPVEDRAFT_41056 [Aspergillus versicolor CBS 583.65]
MLSERRGTSDWQLENRSFRDSLITTTVTTLIVFWSTLYGRGTREIPRPTYQTVMEALLSDVDDPPDPLRGVF